MPVDGPNKRRGTPMIYSGFSLVKSGDVDTTIMASLFTSNLHASRMLQSHRIPHSVLLKEVANIKC